MHFTTTDMRTQLIFFTTANSIFVKRIHVGMNIKFMETLYSSLLYIILYVFFKFILVSLFIKKFIIPVLYNFVWNIFTIDPLPIKIFTSKATLSIQ